MNATNLASTNNFGPNGPSRNYAYDDADNLTFNSGLCSGNPNIVYPAQGVDAAAAGQPSSHPHAPSSICGAGVAYDADGNTLRYDPDGTAGVIQPRSFLYDGEKPPALRLRPGRSALKSIHRIDLPASPSCLTPSPSARTG